jgi:hypothetical protein
MGRMFRGLITRFAHQRTPLKCRLVIAPFFALETSLAAECGDNGAGGGTERQKDFLTQRSQRTQRKNRQMNLCGLCDLCVKYQQSKLVNIKI